jgi:uncharacterized protein
MQQLIVPVADILGRPGEYRDLDVEATLSGVCNALARLDERPVRASLRAESVVEGILVSGSLEGTATVECARCLTERRAAVRLDVCELFVGADREVPEEDAYRLVGTDLELETMLRDAVALALPLKPLCRDDCKGLCATCGRDLNLGACDCADVEVDPRWAALTGLRERLES